MVRVLFRWAYLAARGQDIIVHDLTTVESDEDSSSVQLNSPTQPSDKKQLNPEEKSLCTRRPLQCTAYVMISRQAIKFQEKNEPMAKDGANAKDQDDRRQALRHQYWFAYMPVEWGQAPAWEWALAHEGKDNMKTRDSQCDNENNTEGNKIGIRQAGRLKDGASPQDVKSGIASNVRTNVYYGNYCRR